jgi:AcrR family transcriptional regulator
MQSQKRGYQHPILEGFIMTEHSDLRETIVSTAVALAERSSWEAVRLFDIAAELNVTLDDIRTHFREKEDLIDAWFDRTDGIMLKAAEQYDFSALLPRERLHRLIMTWLNAMADHRTVTRQMIGSKLEPGHIHIQIPAIMRISRTVQWMREAAKRDATFIRRALEETVLTTIYLATFVHWMFDESPGSQKTSDFLTQKLQLAEILDHAVYGTAHRQTDGASGVHSDAEVTPRFLPSNISSVSGAFSSATNPVEESTVAENRTNPQ